MYLTLFLLILAVLMAVAAAYLRSQESAETIALIKKPLLTANEKEFLRRLEQALPQYRVYPQVAMGAILDVPRQQTRRDHLRLRGRFSQKIIDFVICNANLEIITLIELDDRSHQTEKDQARDALTATAGYPTLRFQSRAKPSVPEISAAVEALVAKQATRRPTGKT